MLYICGAKKMSEDVETTIIELIKKSGSVDDADAYINELKTEGRYLKDVY
jgi:sulfite reductase alpha subunit-like flavoprotein